MAWQNTTRFAQGEKDRSPKTWTARLTPEVTVAITKGHIHYKGSWVMHCKPWFDTYELGTEDAKPEDVQEQALAMVKEKIEQLHATLTK